MSIVVVLPWLKPHRQHMEHFIEWYAENKHRHNLILYRSFWKALHQAQALGLKLARTINGRVKSGELSKDRRVTHILFTEDDQWGYPVDGLDVLLEADKDVIGFKTYFKKYPFNSMAMRKKDPSLSMIEMHPNFVNVEQGDGPEIQEVDLVSWAFTLVKMDVFDRLQKVGKDPFRQWGPHPTDSFFNQYCEDLGIRRYVHFGFTIGHGDVAPDEIWLHRRMEEARRATKGQMAQREVGVVADDYDNPYGQAEHLSEVAKVLEGTT